MVSRFSDGAVRTPEDGLPAKSCDSDSFAGCSLSREIFFSQCVRNSASHPSVIRSQGELPARPSSSSFSFSTSLSKKSFRCPSSLSPGDRVAVLAPSSGLAARFPWLRDQGLCRLREEFCLEPVPYPTLSDLNPTVEARAKDLNSALADPEVKAIVCSIGGDDLIRVLPLLDREVLRQHARNPKFLLGFSDITSLHLALWRDGVVSYYGGNLLTQFSISGRGMHPFTKTAFMKSLFQAEQPQLLTASPFVQDGYLEWGDEDNLGKEAPKLPNEGWVWHSWPETEKGECAPSVFGGRLWGGCLSTLFTHLGIRTYIPSAIKLKNCVLFLETSESMPSAAHVYEFMSTLGAMGLLRCFSAILVGRPKTFDRGLEPPEGREAYKQAQRKAILRAVTEFCRDRLPCVVFGLDFGHTDPQILVPSGGLAIIDSAQKSIKFIADWQQCSCSCGKSFQRWQTFKNHIAKCHGSCLTLEQKLFWNAHCCTLCGGWFRGANGLSIHMSKSHCHSAPSFTLTQTQLHSRQT
ncbi:MAG: LD-carboxypeptidase [archaeon]|nr:LD-carboxypeptidase [archaeon]